MVGAAVELRRALTASVYTLPPVDRVSDRAPSRLLAAGSTDRLQ